MTADTEHPLAGSTPSRLAEDVAYRRACREFVKGLQRDHIARLERERCETGEDR